MTPPHNPSLSASLHHILVGNDDDAERALSETLQHNGNDNELQGMLTGDEHDNTNNRLNENFCVECADQEADLYCSTCREPFCDMCYTCIHRTGTRTRHEVRRLREGITPAKRSADQTESQTGDVNEQEPENGDIWDSAFLGQAVQSSGGANFGDWITQRAKYIPLRLTIKERKQLRLLEAALNVSEYTDVVDVISYVSKTKRIVAQIKELCAIISGLVVASDYKCGQELFADRDFEENEVFYQHLMEIGRRHKIMNPEKMRSAYGKLMYLLQDSVTPEVQSALQFSLVRDIKTVYSILEEAEGLDLLQHELVAAATKEIVPEGKDRRVIQREIKEKERAVEYLASKFHRPGLSADQIRRCLYSIGDNHSYLRSNRDPCDKMINLLTTYFNPSSIDPGFSLAIQSGRGGARLTHSHETQFYYCQQSLHLWREILHEMFMLWSLADRDLLNSIGYRLRDTGQGLNRVQNCPKVSRTMHSILHRAQQKAGTWIGSSVIHLGDTNVPNALMFIDKYTQIQSILGPLCNIMDRLDEVNAVPACKSMIDAQYGSLEGAKKTILADYFKYAFDGSGADNSFDAGSCIDGRLTSSWNWCSMVHKKPYYHIFLLCGFNGFNGHY